MLITSNKLSVHSVSSVDYGSSNILITIPSDVSPFSLISYASQSEASKNLLNIRSINEIDINVFDENNNYIDFNNLDWTITLTLSSEVNFNELTNITWDTIKNEQNQLLINEMNKKNIDLQHEQQQEEKPEPEPPKEETQAEKELKLLNY